MPKPSIFRLVHLPPDLASQMRDSVDEAFQSLGSATAELVLHYARLKHHVNVSELPEGIEELDKALKEMLGTGSRIVVNNCAQILSRRLGKDIQAKTNKLADVFRQVLKVYRIKPAGIEQEIPALLDDEEENALQETDI